MAQQLKKCFYHKLRLKTFFIFSKYFPCNPGTGFGIGQCIVVIDKVVATGGSYGMKLMIWKLMAEVTARCSTSAEKLIIRIIHLVAAHDCLKASLVERTIVRHQWQAFDEWLYLFPNVWKHRRIFGIRLGDAMNQSIPIQVIVRLWLDKGVERIYELPFPHDHNAHAAHAGTLVVGGLEIDGGKVVHSAKIANSNFNAENIQGAWKNYKLAINQKT